MPMSTRARLRNPFASRTPRKHKDVAKPKLFLFILLVRLVNATTLETYFQADEFYQCLEPAHRLVYGYGYLTWEWHQKLRSSIHPLIYALGYLVAGENRFLIRQMPKVIGAVVASVGDFYLHEFVQVYDNDGGGGGGNLGWVALCLSLLNPFNWYVSTRSFSNNLETTLTIVALRYWPWDHEIGKGSWYISLACGVVSCIIRPTNALIQIPLGIWLLVNTRISRTSAEWIYLSVLVVLAILALSTGLDYLFYGELTFPLYNFLEFNVIKNLSIFYGVAPWHFYIAQAIPLMMMTYIPMLVYGIRCSILLATSLIYLAGLSLLQHKEFRFILPLQPIMLYYAARGYRKLKAKYLVILGVFANIAIALFFANVNERGVMDLVDFLESTNSSVGFVMPCHSTPWQSHFHNPDLQMWFLTCEPPLHLNAPTLDEIKAYRDESDQFYDDPAGFLARRFGTDLVEPEYVAIFSPLEKVIDQELGGRYIESNRFFNSYFHWDGRRNGDIVLYRKIDHNLE
ncbi:uncharacterized protein LODBEIA_P55360 [Lodderomyces beijingensis]|uniref:Mannosyltransferase n=1 Tax=Lodderomyces beijingensis TaxID=1775926 RepID=A0ABP0ZWC4_9ASCO